MKHKLLLAACAALLILSSCENKPIVVTAVIDFEYNRTTPLMVRFTNLSSGFESYKWDFGDGTWAYGDDAIKTYEATGKYTVTLTGTMADGEKYDRRKTIEITVPDIYFAGYTFYAIPYENKYYKLVVKDDALLPSDWDWFTRYTPLLDNSDMPYTYYFQNPVMIENPNSHDYWTVQVVRNTTTNGSADDVSCVKGKITRKELLEYRQEYIIKTESGSTAVGVHMGYDY